MPPGLSVAIALLVQAAGAPAGPPKAAPSATPAANDACEPNAPKADQREIIICAQRPNGYRLNPDVTEARKELRNGGHPPRPDATRVSQCGSVGPQGCMVGGVDLLAAGITAATMIGRAVKGENVGEMFVTDPHPSEYQLYLMAKKRREAHEAEIAAKKKAEAAAASAPAEAQPR